MDAIITTTQRHAQQEKQKKPRRPQHQKLNPQFFSGSADHKSRYDSIEKAKANAENFYWFPNKWLRGLRYWIRSERREAIVRFVQVLLHYTHLSNLSVGCPNNGRWWAPTLEQLAGYAGISIRRAIRVQSDLIAGGYMTVKKRKKFRNGRFIGLVSIRTISEKLFFDLGVRYESFKKQCGKAVYRLNKKIKELEKQLQEQQFKNFKEKGRAWLKLAQELLKNKTLQ